MALARYFIGDESVEYRFNEADSMDDAIDYLAMLYYEKTSSVPAVIYLSLDLYSIILMQNVGHHVKYNDSVIKSCSFYTSIGSIPIKLATDDVKLFIYAGSESGYHNALQAAKIDKHFEDIVFGDENEA